MLQTLRQPSFVGYRKIEDTFVQGSVDQTNELFAIFDARRKRSRQGK